MLVEVGIRGSQVRCGAFEISPNSRQSIQHVLVHLFAAAAAAPIPRVVWTARVCRRRCGRVDGMVLVALAVGSYLLFLHCFEAPIDLLQIGPKLLQLKATSSR